MANKANKAKATKATKATESNEIFVQLATRIPKSLHRALKMHCVTSDVSLMQYVINALGNALPAKARKAS